jgi:hypothetical protein
MLAKPRIAAFAEPLTPKQRLAAEAFGTMQRSWRDMPFVPEGRPPRPSEFYIPRLGQIDAPRRLPAPISEFVARFRALFDAEIYIPKYLDLTALGGLADYIHILARTHASDEWIFQRFAPACAACMGMDLTGAKISDPHLAPYNVRLDEKLARLARQEAPLYGKTRLNTPHRGFIVHWLFVPMSDTGQIITHCLLMLAWKGGENHDYRQSTANLGQYSEAMEPRSRRCGDR